jgi:O-antigen/teichoic acid export membrane protein
MNDVGLRGSGASRGLTVRTLRSMTWTGGGAAAEMVLQAIIMMILACLLGPADFGIVTVALVATGFVGLFGELGLTPAIIQRETLTPVHVRTAFTTSLAFALGIGAALAVLSSWVARFFAMPGVAPMVSVMAFSLVIKAWGSMPSALLQRAMRFRDIAVASIVSYLVGFGLVGIGMAAAGFGPWSLIAAHMTQTLVQSLALHFAQPVPHRLGVDPRALQDLVAYGGGVSFARFANYLALRGDNMVVGHTLGPTALGLYGPAYHLMAMPADLFQRVVQSVLFPAISRLQTEPERLAATYRRGLAVIGLTVLPATALTILLAPPLVDVLLGPRWRGVTAPLQILAAGMFFRVGYKMSVVVVKATGAVRPFALRQIPYPLMVVSFAWIGTRWGLSGVALGVVIALAVHYALLTTLGLRVAGLTVGDYIRAHRSALVLTTVVFVQAWLVIAATRAGHLPAAVNLPLVGLSTAVVVAALVWWVPGSVLGADGMWFRQSLGRFAMPAMRRDSRPGRSVAPGTLAPVDLPDRDQAARRV